MKDIKPRSDIDAVVKITGSKSVTHRALIAAALAQGESLLEASLASEDTLYTINGLRQMGVRTAIGDENATVFGTGGSFPQSAERKEIFLGNSGTSYRLLLSIVALAKGEYILTGTPRMHQRPIGDLVKALRTLGVEASCLDQEGFPPVLIRAQGIHGGKVRIAGDKSSQYISSLLLAAPYAEKDVEIELTGDLVSKPYVDVTVDVMKGFGVQVIRDGYRYFRISAGQKYKSCPYNVDGDVSGASYFWAAAAVTGGTVTTENIHPRTTRQGDIGLLDILEEMGCALKREPDKVVVKGGPL
jgi:3-phosphoshikimate 1-carboxyvinyltransferase